MNVGIGTVERIAWTRTSDYSWQGAGFSIATASVGGVWRFTLWDGDEHIGAFDSQVEAEDVAEFLRERKQEG